MARTIADFQTPASCRLVLDYYLFAVLSPHHRLSRTSAYNYMLLHSEDTPATTHGHQPTAVMGASTIMSSTSTVVLDTYELLEIILLRIPMKQLFVYQRVSKTWRSVIERSANLQKKMFLRASAEPLKPHLHRPPAWNNELWTVNAAGDIRFNPIVRLAKTLHGTPGADLTLCCVALERQLLHCHISETHPEVFEFDLDLDIREDESDIKGTSWKTLLITQPPITVIENRDPYEYQDLHTATAFTVLYRATGLTVGDFFHWKQMHPGIYRPLFTLARAPMEETVLQAVVNSRCDGSPDTDHFACFRRIYEE